MPHAQVQPASWPPERRTAARVRVDCPVLLQTAGGDRRGQLCDLSEFGARVQVESPPQAGIEALLKWHGHEVFCRVVWATGDTCGVAFDRPIARAVVAETVGGNEAPSGPRAALGNIPIGVKRARPAG